MISKKTRSGFDPDHRVVFPVLQGIDCVISDCPHRQGEKQDDVRKPDHPGGRSGHQNAPIEGQSQPGLRPERNSLHVWIGRHQWQGEQGYQFCVQRKAEPHQKADQKLRAQKGVSPVQCNCTRRDRPPGCAGNLCIDLAIGNVVPSAARAAHGDRANTKQDRPAKICPGKVAGDRRESQANPARQRQQPDANRAINPRQRQIRSAAVRQGLEKTGRNRVRRAQRHRGARCRLNVHNGLFFRHITHARTHRAARLGFEQ